MAKVWTEELYYYFRLHWTLWSDCLDDELKMTGIYTKEENFVFKLIRYFVVLLAQVHVHLTTGFFFIVECLNP